MSAEFFSCGAKYSILLISAAQYLWYLWDVNWGTQVSHYSPITNSVPGYYNHQRTASGQWYDLRCDVL